MTQNPPPITLDDLEASIRRSHSTLDASRPKGFATREEAIQAIEEARAEWLLSLPEGQPIVRRPLVDILLDGVRGATGL
jgi:hypothetical protein